jgi:sigma-B regulation protein RsbU (phosphoserine phosphatase)
MSGNPTEEVDILFSVRTKILLVFLALSITALLIAGYLAFTQIGDVSRVALESNSNLGSRASADSAKALEEDARISLLRLTIDQADISNIIFERVVAKTNVMAFYAAEIMADPAMIRKRDIHTPDDIPIDPRTTSVLYLSPGIQENLPVRERDAIGMMDQIFIPILTTDSDLSAVYVGTDTGMSLICPWTSGFNATFDPRLRDWFIQAKKRGNITWSEPYVDLLGHGLMMTCSKPVYYDQEGWIWVIGTDVTIETINQNIIGTQVGDRGYAMLVDEQGNVITRPGLSAGDMRWDETFVTENLFQSNNPGLVAAVQNMTSGEVGISRVTYDDGDRFIAYAPVVSVNWSVALVMPVDEVIAPAYEARDRILNASEDTAYHITRQQEMMRTFFIITFIGLLIIVCLLTIFFSRILTRPLLELQKGSEAIGSGDLNYRVVVTSRDEFGSLARSFNTMADDLKEYISTLRRTTAERERMLRELEIAKGIQQSFLPESAPVLKGYDLEGYNLPAAEVGGDFYDFIPVGDESWGLVIADVSGKGVPAALFMALSSTLIRASTSGNQDPAESIIDANRHICLDSKTSMFVTLFYAILDTGKCTLTFVNAGHNPPLLIGSDLGEITLLKARGIALGVIDEIDLESIEVQLKPGSLVVLYTDGITEATNEKNEEYGTERLTSLAERMKKHTSREIIDAIVDDVTTFAHDRPQFDDITIMVLKVQ